MVQNEVGGLGLARPARAAQLPLYRRQSRLMPVPLQHEGIRLAAIITIGALLLIAAQYYYWDFAELRATAHGKTDKQRGLIAEMVIEQKAVRQVPESQFYGLSTIAGGIRSKTGIGKEFHQRLTLARIIFDDQNRVAHV
jgi:hypothetical protein